MMNTPEQSGFSAVELLIALFIATVFITSGYQLWSYVQASGAEADQLAKASNISYTYIRKYTATSLGECATVAGTKENNVTPDNSTGLPLAKILVIISCPSSYPSNVSKITSTVTYGTPQKSVTHAIYAN